MKRTFAEHRQHVGEDPAHRLGRRRDRPAARGSRKNSSVATSSRNDVADDITST